MDEHEPSCCPLPHLTHDQWTALCDATRVLKPILRRRWPNFRSYIEDAVAEALTIVACKVKDGVMPFPDSFETLVDVLSQKQQPSTNAKNAIAVENHRPIFYQMTTGLICPPMMLNLCLPSF
jgi:hypothetical protein